MRCPKGNVVYFINEDLPAEKRQAFDEHLLECEQCWQALQQDRAGRAAAMTLRSPTPEWLADRITLMVEVAGLQADGVAAMSGGSRQHRPKVFAGATRVLQAGVHRRLRVIGALALSASLLGAGLAWLLSDSPASRDPAQVALVVSMARQDAHVVGVAPSATRVRAAGQLLVVKTMRYHGQIVLVATSTSPFPMPSLSHVLTGSSMHAWMATQGSIAEYCVNQSAGKSSMLVVAEMPEAELPNVAAHLHLI